ncbi:MAG TPA: hypothetical protein VES88_07310 [Gemmatimonadaceae bacterium]|nr:hypothetical protein [Gemmatimonadaceae bacterium]
MSNAQKQQVVELLKSIETGDSKPVAFINADKYIQHNLAVGDGLAGFGAVLQALPKGSAKVRTVRVFQDGDFVFAHTDYNFFGPRSGSTSSVSRTARSSSIGTTFRRRRLARIRAATRCSAGRRKPPV